MDRYSNITKTTRWDGKKTYTSVTYPLISPQDSDIIIVTDETTYLDALAQKYYNDYMLYWVIILANSGLGNGRLSVPAGMTLRIPVNINLILNQFNQLNS